MSSVAFKVLKMHKNRLRLGFALDPSEKFTALHQTTYLDLNGPTSKAPTSKGRKEKGEEGEEGRERKAP